MDQLFPTSMKENIRDKFLKSSLPARPILKKATKVVVNTVRQLNRFRLSEEETNALAFDEDEEGSEVRCHNVGTS